MSLFKGTHTTTKADKINQFQATICEYGAVVPDIVGTTKISPNLINWQDFYAQTLKKTTKQGKAKSTTINYDYYVYMELALAEKITGLGNVWVGDKKYNSLAEANGTTKAEGFPLVLYKDGGMTPYMRDNHSEIAVEYKDLAFLASPAGGNTSATYLGENTASVPSYAFEVKGQLLNTGDGVDVNPADYILHILKQVGIWNGEGNEENIVEGIGRYRAYCAGMDMLISSPKEQQQGQAQAVIKSLMDLTDCYFFWSNNRFKVVVKDNRRWPGFTPNTTVIYDLTADDMLPQSNGAVVLFSRKDSSEQYNRFTIQWCNREKDYEDETISYEIIDDIQANGLRQASQISAPYIYKRERAIKACQLQARRAEREKNKYTIKLDWAYAIIEPGDLLTLTDPVIGLNRQPVIVDKVTEAKNGILTVECLQYFEGDYAVGIIDMWQDDYTYIDYNTVPDYTAEPLIFQPPYKATVSGNEIWIALKGMGVEWGGCNVLAANQDSGFEYVGEFRAESQYGKLVSISKNEMVAIINGDFDNLTEADAESGKLFFWVDGECISYRNAVYNGNGEWQFFGITRGLYDTEILDHAEDADIVFCNGSIFAIELSQNDAERTYYFKFPAMNVFGNNLQPEEDCESVAFTVGELQGGGEIPDGSITGEKLAENTIPPTKLNVSNLSAITATIGTLRTATTGARTEIKDNLIEVYDNNNVLRVRLGVW